MSIISTPIKKFHDLEIKLTLKDKKILQEESQKWARGQDSFGVCADVNCYTGVVKLKFLNKTEFKSLATFIKKKKWIE